MPASRIGNIAYLLYEEILFKYQEHTKGLDGVRFFGGYGFNPTQEWAVTLGFILRYQLQSSGRDFNVLFRSVVRGELPAWQTGADAVRLRPSR